MRRKPGSMSYGHITYIKKQPAFTKCKLSVSPLIFLACISLIGAINGFAAGAPAPRSFSDVPRSDWAYIDIRKLAEAEIICGDGVDQPIDAAPAGAASGTRLAAKPAFRPDDILTREECSVIVARIDALINARQAARPADEKLTENKYTTIIQTEANSSGIINSAAKPADDPLASQTARAKPGAAPPRSFRDVSEDMWSYPYVESAKNYFTGYHAENAEAGAPVGEPFFLPHAPALRGDFVSALIRLRGTEKRYINYSVLEPFADGADVSDEWKPYIAAAIERSILLGDEDMRLNPGDPVTRREACALTVRALKGVLEFPEPATQKIYAPDTDSGFYDAFFSDAVFVGDSITMGLRNYVLSARARGAALLGDARFLCAGSYGIYAAAGAFNPDGVNLSYQGADMPLEDCLLEMGAKDAYLMLGMNDQAGANLPDSIIKYGAVIDKIIEKNPGINVCVQFCTPITQEREAAKLNNENMDRFNLAIAGMCGERNLDCVDVSAPLKDENNALRREYASDNYVHMSSSGCLAWIGALRAFARDKYIAARWAPPAGAGAPESYPGSYVEID